MNRTTLAFTITTFILIVVIYIQHDISIDLKQRMHSSNQRSELLHTELRNAKSKIESLSTNSYDLKQIKNCMYSSSIRQQVIHNVVYGTRKLTPAENTEYQKLLPIISKNKDSSSQILLFQLIDESSKIDNECLRHANRIINA